MARNIKIAAFLAFKSIVKGNKATTALIIFILSLAFVNLVFIAGILNGVLEGINKQVVTNLVSNIVIEPQEEPTKKDFIIHARDIMDQVEKIPGVTAVTSRYKLAGTLAFDKEKNGKFKFRSGEIIGVDPENEKNISNIASKIISGEYLEGLGNGEILLGSSLAGGYGDSEDLIDLGGVRVGDKVQVTFSNQTVKEYKVKGIFRVQFGFVDRLAFITTKEAESILGVHDNASQILVKIKDTGSEDGYVDQIKTFFPNLRVDKWNNFVGALGNVSKSFDMITLIISAIGLAVAAITIFILIYVEVVHKRRQIGILKAIGIKQNIIIYSYIFQALFYVSLGVVIGTLLTLYVLVPFFSGHPLRLPVGETGLALNKLGLIYNALSLFLAALIAGFIPSWRGAKENILKAIWGA
ncbi:MAG: FtsX-like permease family protein [Patescibacteria group bacterium]|nr:FtsX-like permease family protein [Patescibacteria group bacterium]